MHWIMQFNALQKLVAKACWRIESAFSNVCEISLSLLLIETDLSVSLNTPVKTSICIILLALSIKFLVMLEFIVCIHYILLVYYSLFKLGVLLAFSDPYQGEKYGIKLQK